MTQPTLTDLLIQTWDNQPEPLSPAAERWFADQFATSILHGDPAFWTPVQQAISALVAHINNEGN